MSRHNRRRTRGAHKSSSSLSYVQRPHDSDSDSDSDSGLDVPLDMSSSLSSSLASNFHSPFAQPTSSTPKATNKIMLNNRSGVSARHWHNRYMAWQARERRQSEEKAKLAAEKKRIFGESDVVDGDEGEDEMLCVRMLEYFGGLDFIDG